MYYKHSYKLHIFFVTQHMKVQGCNPHIYCRQNLYVSNKFFSPPPLTPTPTPKHWWWWQWHLTYAELL